MKTPVAHAPEDRLLDFAYDELPRPEAHAVEQHLQDCPRCAETLRGIRGVRRAMARLPVESEPSAGLDSLLAYAQQSARRAAAGAEPAPRWWRRLLAPALGMAAVSLFGVVVLQVNREVDLTSALQRSPASDRSLEAQSMSVPESAPPVAATAPPSPPPASAPAPALALKPKAYADWGNALPGGGHAEKKGAARSRAAVASEQVVGGIAGGGAYEMPTVQTSPPASPAPSPAPEARAKEEFQATPEASKAAPKKEARKDAAPSPAAKSMDKAQADDRSGLFAEQEADSASRAPRPVARASPSPAELLRQADLALRAGNRVQEVAFLRAALSAGARGSEALGALSRLCDSESLLGLRSAVEVCKRVVATAPDSNEARAAQRQLKSLLPPTPEPGATEPEAR